MKERIEDALKNNVSRRRYFVTEDSRRTIIHSRQGFFTSGFFRDIATLKALYMVTEIDGQPVVVFHKRDSELID